MRRSPTRGARASMAASGRLLGAAAQNVGSAMRAHARPQSAGCISGAVVIPYGTGRMPPSPSCLRDGMVRHTISSSTAAARFHTVPAAAAPGEGPGRDSGACGSGPGVAGSAAPGGAWRPGSARAPASASVAWGAPSTAGGGLSSSSYLSGGNDGGTGPRAPLPSALMPKPRDIPAVGPEPGNSQGWRRPGWQQRGGDHSASASVRPASAAAGASSQSAAGGAAAAASSSARAQRQRAASARPAISSTAPLSATLPAACPSSLASSLRPGSALGTIREAQSGAAAGAPAAVPPHAHQSTAPPGRLSELRSSGGSRAASASGAPDSLASSMRSRWVKRAPAMPALPRVRPCAVYATPTASTSSSHSDTTTTARAQHARSVSNYLNADEVKTLKQLSEEYGAAQAHTHSLLREADKLLGAGGGRHGVGGDGGGGGGGGHSHSRPGSGSSAAARRRAAASTAMSPRQSLGGNGGGSAAGSRPSSSRPSGRGGTGAGTRSSSHPSIPEFATVPDALTHDEAALLSEALLED